ncbi:CUE domain-containing protein 2 isoform X2 [Narcine bancroftii]|uniref:CUE domain-containing protein 2 isoform X2 n=2 Tax=Narcine bancroftii TaxID=1343680 RepID=UPI003831737F
MRWAGACPRRDLERAISFRVGRLAAGNGVASCTSSPADTMAMEKIIRDSLAQFVHSYIPDADFGVMDDVILSYITGVLEELGSPDSSEENFDVEMFVEMMEAYIPGFAEISSVAIYEMMFDLAAQLIEARNKENVPPPVCSQDTVSSLNKQQMSDWEQKSSVELESGFVAGVGATAKEAGVEKEDGIQLLVEMFPSCSVSTMRHALSVAKGDMDYAVQLIIEGSVEGLDTPTSEEARPKTDKKIKASILEKYMMVDNEEDVKIHKPIAPKEAPKKLIRYIDNQVVSTKGERYTEVKKAESDEMKKTYINLKPARKYKFH